MAVGERARRATAGPHRACRLGRLGAMSAPTKAQDILSTEALEDLKEKNPALYDELAAKVKAVELNPKSARAYGDAGLVLDLYHHD